MVTEYNEVFSSDKHCDNGVNVYLFKECLHFQRR